MGGSRSDNTTDSRSLAGLAPSRLRRFYLPRQLTMLGTWTVLSLFAAVPLRAQQPDPLAPLVNDALRNNGLVEAARYRESRAFAESHAVRARLLPSLDLDSRFSQQSGTINLGDFVNPVYSALNQVTGTNRFPTGLDLTLPQRYDSHVRLSLPLFQPALWASTSAASHQYDAERLQRMTVARRLAARVQTAWLEARSAAAAVAIRKANLTRATENLRTTQKLVDAGTATPDALFRARAERSAAEQQVIEARDAASSAGRVVNQLAGRPLDTPLDQVPDSLLIRPIPFDRDQALARALSRREELAQLDAGIAARGAQVRAAGASFLPSVNLALDYGFQGRDVTFSGRNDYWVGSVVLSWNLFRGGADQARVSAARAGRDALEAERRDAEGKIRLEVMQSYDAAVAARSAMQVSEDQLAAAEKAFELIQRRYQEGEASQVELIDARSALTTAELNREVTLYRYAERLVDLERAAAVREVE